MLQQGLFALLWSMLAVAGLARRSAAHWALGTAAVSVGMALVLARASVPPWLGFWAANLCFFAGFAAMRRGVELFARRPPADREHLLIVLLLPPLAQLHGGAGPSWTAVVSLSLALAYVVARAAWTVQTRLRDEFGARMAAGCAVPMWLVALMLAGRGLAGPFMPTLITPAVDGSQPVNLAMLLSFVASGILLTLGLVLLVISRLVIRLRHLSDHDALTGVLNRRSIERALGEQAAQLLRHGRPYAVLAIDVDHFKRINDRHGHPAGDAVLRELAATLRQTGRTGDLVARTGGEEFWLLLPDTRMAGARQVADRLQGLVRALKVSVPGAEVTLTVSIGLAVADDAREDTAALIRRLDEALYRAKDLGRDRVELAAPHPVDSPPAARGLAVT